ncbi:hypothetical protein M2163_005614 [Streptomyces sp. SAI-135]|uniref:hypothetical protein n=1 Tax=unclassified Streptomyces TaxID=2593676 RepID=UPI002472FEC3|nr:MULTISPECIES: hypothetical protein [unclassified Streptomyces]MDH6517405.1 hypothetical protein [Streptomyces sp. SAI-090]MDH6618506.1 hypothetical protein [Streptomyces sp. SAI-135]
MSSTQEHLLDTYRARHLGTPVPPAPGTHDVRTVRDLRAYRRFRAVLAGRPAPERLRHVLSRWLRRQARPGC